MALSMGGWFGFLMGGITRYDSNGYDPWTIVLLASSIASIALGVFAFRRAAKIGRREDEIEALKNADIESLVDFIKNMK